MRISDWSSDVCSSDLLSEKVWKPFGMEADGVWMLGPTGHEISGCCMSARLRDYARFGQFILGGGVAGGEKVLPDDWLAAATTKQADIDLSDRGYGYQWRSEEHTSELQSLMRISYAVFCLKKKKNKKKIIQKNNPIYKTKNIIT